MKNTHSIKYSRQPWEFLYLVLSAGFRHRKEKMYQQDITINNEFYTYRQSLQKNAYISTPLLNFKYHIWLYSYIQYFSVIFNILQKKIIL